MYSPQKVGNREAQKVSSEQGAAASTFSPLVDLPGSFLGRYNVPLLCISTRPAHTTHAVVCAGREAFHAPMLARVWMRACSQILSVRFFPCPSLSVLVLGGNQIAAKGAGKLAGVLAQCQHSCTLSAVLQGSSISSEGTTELPRGSNKRAHNNGPCGEFAKHRRADSESEAERCDKGARRE